MLVKLFKKEPDSTRMVDLLGAIDERRDWYGCTSRWSLLEVARALKKDGKPRELIELDLKELETTQDLVRRGHTEDPIRLRDRDRLTRCLCF